MKARVDELMVCRIASEVDGSGVTVLGSFTPLAYASYILAKLTHARDATLVGYNAVDFLPMRLTLTGIEAAAYSTAAAHWPFGITTQTVHMGGRGLVECISPAQIDGSGAYNLSAIGDDYRRPKVRLPGGAGSPEVVQHYRRLIAYVGRHDARTLTDHVDFVTGQRWPIDPEARRARGLLEGPVRIVTPLAVLRKDNDRDPFWIETLHPGADLDEVVAGVGFELDVPDEIGVTEEPTEEQLRLLREEIDPSGTTQFDFMDAASRRALVKEIMDEEWAGALARVKGER